MLFEALAAEVNLSYIHSPSTQRGTEKILADFFATNLGYNERVIIVSPANCRAKSARIFSVYSQRARTTNNGKIHLSGSDIEKQRPTKISVLKLLRRSRTRERQRKRIYFKLHYRLAP